ncbi:MAG TPA: hypothetical protein VFE47_26245, partial [Tepidisphaeraceae bacterium]|nr:hypothetical protein [Tepidisphaeraceae bacterium]
GAKFTQPGDLQVFDKGRSVLVQGYANDYTTFLLTEHGGDVVVHKTAGAPRSSSMDRFVVDHNGNLWSRGMRRKDELAIYSHAGDEPAYIAPGGRPLFCDSKNRIWIVSETGGVVRVHLPDADTSLTIDGATWSSRLAETPDGRIFLFHSKGMSELVVSGKGKSLLLSERNHWVEGFPIGKGTTCFFSDTHGSLWILIPGQLLRFAPPK